VTDLDLTLASHNTDQDPILVLSCCGRAVIVSDLDSWLGIVDVYAKNLVGAWVGCKPLNAGVAVRGVHFADAQSRASFDMGAFWPSNSLTTPTKSGFRSLIA
jgi:hypothetical protein